MPPKKRLVRHVTEKASQQFKTTTACTLFLADLLFATFGCGIFVLVFLRRPETVLVFDAEVWLLLQLSSALLVVLALATCCGWCIRVMYHDREQRQLSSRELHTVDTPARGTFSFSLWFNRWDSRDNWLLWTHGAALGVLMIGVLIGLMFVTSVDQAVSQSTSSDFKENSTTPANYLQQVVLKHMQEQIDRTFRGDSKAGEGQCLFRYTDAANVTFVDTSYGLTLHTNDSFPALSAPITCPGTQRTWY